MKITDIKMILETTPLDTLQEKIDFFCTDERAGVQKLCQTYHKRIIAQEEARVAWTLKLDFDAVFHDNQYVLVGIDEVGRGPLSGPVVASAVILPYECEILGLRDSKKLSESKREMLFEEIQKVAIAIGVGIVEAPVIDEINILQATFQAMRMALDEISVPYNCILVDGDKAIPKIDTLQHAIIGGDDKSGAIAAASVIAKVTRDRMMKEYAKTYPEYDWESNKGYGSSKHYEGIRKYGITPLHRKSFLKNEGIV